MTPAAPPDPLAWADPELKQRLLADPVGVLRDRGINLPPSLPQGALLDIARVTFLLWQDGNVVPLSRFRVDPADEGLLFGKGVWESTRTVDGVPWLWDDHLARLTHTAALLNLSAPADRLPGTRAVTEFVRSLSSQDVVVRLNVSAGRPGHAGTVWMTAAFLPQPRGAVRLKSQVNVVPADQPYLVWKTFQYAGRLLTGQQAAAGGEFDSALLVTTAGELLEASHANIFLRFADGWATPPVAAGPLLPGTVRRHVLANAPVPVRERPVTLAEVGGATEVFLTNSNVGLVPVTRIDGHEFPLGEETQHLARWILKG